MIYYHTLDEYSVESYYSISRFMIDQRYQQKGYGKQAMSHILNYIKTFPLGKASFIVLSYKPNNDIAKKMYGSLGFVETGEIIDGELVAKLNF